VSIECPVRLVCDRCRATTSGLMIVDKLRPMPAMHLRLPEGWTATTNADSGEICTQCAACSPDTFAPSPLVGAEWPEAGTDPMLTLPPQGE
jgi:hypothetical protein